MIAMKLIAKKTLMCLIWAGLGASLHLWAAPVTQLPYECTFEDSTEWSQWTTKRYSLLQTVNTEWQMGNATAYMGEKSMYVSVDGGITAGYGDFTSGYNSIAYRTFSLSAGSYDLSFMWRSLGSASDAACVAWVPVSITPEANAVGTSFPNYMNTYIVNLSNTTSNILQGSTAWQNSKGTLVVPTGGGDYQLVFCWRRGGSGAATIANPGACIDNLQISKTALASDCFAIPTNLAITNTSSGSTFSWTGNASTYELEYFKMGSTVVNTVGGISGTSYTVPVESLPEGVYYFRVRAICTPDTSLWAESSASLIYDATAHCLDYLNFNAPGVTCTSGTYNSDLANSVFSTIGAIDHGYASIESRHTVHYIPGETDPRTNGMLPTVPNGELATVRLGNWDAGGYGQSVTYTVPVDSTMGVLQLKYAVVAQSGGHDSEEQPIFYMRILDSSGNTINGECGVADFRPPTSGSGVNGWHIGNASDVYWREWTTVGINLQAYNGQTVRVQLISAGCVYSAHWGYAYFTLDCSDGKMKGLSCGVQPDKFEVDEGFNYRWYKKFDATQTVVGTQNIFVLPSASDTATYCCDMIQPNNASCYFTLEASAVARLPKARATLSHTPSNCTNYITVENNSGVFGYYGDNASIETDLNEECSSYLWTIETTDSTWTSNQKNPEIIAPNTGGMVRATLYVTIANDDCTDTQSFEIIAPAIGDTVGVDTKYMCYGETAYFNGKAYTETGIYTDSLKTYAGCDSLLTFELKVLKTDTILMADTICSYETYDFFGSALNTTGIYTHSVPSSLGSCDSLYYELNLTVLEALNMSIDYESQILCSGNMTISVPYEVYSGAATKYDLLFDAVSHDRGFEDVLNQPVLTADNVDILLTSEVWAGDYSANLVFYNADCGNMEFPISFTVYYNADSVITQRWNDLLSVRKAAYDYYGGFTEYQWYKNDEPLVGATGTQLYEPETKLDLSAEYSVELVRAADGVRMRSCGFVPVQGSDEVLLVSPTKAPVTQQINVYTSVPGKVRFCTQLGVIVYTANLTQGDNFLSLPGNAGIYMLQIDLDNGKSQCKKIIVE